MSLQVRGREPARPHNVPSYEDKALCQSQRFELDIRKDWQGAGGLLAGGAGSFRGLSEVEGGPGDLGRGLAAVESLHGLEEETCTGSWRAGAEAKHSPRGQPARPSETLLCSRG